MMLKLGAAYFELKAALCSIYDEQEAAALSHATLGHITGLEKLARLDRKDNALTTEQEADFLTFKKALVAGEPFQYLVGKTFFLGRQFEVNPSVLIPRPETEELVTWIMEVETPVSILDIGTGSGCIAVSLKLAFPGAEVTALDLSDQALAVARLNAQKNEAEVAFVKGDFLDSADALLSGTYDLIVSNPPYIPETESDTLHPNVRDHEPGMALFVPGNDPLLFYRAIATYGQKHLNANGSIYCELHRDYAAATQALFMAHGYTVATIRNDLHGAPRMLHACL